MIYGAGSGVQGGEFFFTGDGTTKDFFLNHNIGHNPSRTFLTAMNLASLNAWATTDATFLGMHFNTAPANGVGIVLSWECYP